MSSKRNRMEKYWHLKAVVYYHKALFKQTIGNCNKQGSIETSAPYIKHRQNLLTVQNQKKAKPAVLFT